MSTRAQTVTSAALGQRFGFEAGEVIYTEQSQKYSRATIDHLAAASGFAIDAFVTDPRGWYALVVCAVR